MKIKSIGLMDFGTRSKNIDTLSIIDSVINDAVLAEQLGFSRLWYGEHFITSANIPWFSPDLLLPLICGNTNTIRVGLAGVLAGYTSAIRTASGFKLMNNLFNDRIDLGFAKGAPNKGFTPYFNRPKITTNQEGQDHLQSQIKSIVSLLLDEEIHLKEGIVMAPYKGNIPQLWNLGGSAHSYTASLEFRTNCSRTIFHQGVDHTSGLEELKRYREKFHNQFGVLPQINIAVAGFCSSDQAEITNVINTSESEHDFVDVSTRLCSTPSEFYDKVTAYAEHYDVDEIIFFELARVPEQRRESMAKISEIFALGDKQELVA
jgi:alkanesulfonate monooxygenase SsuD/methylene tetrahydromethanopterin reductase-like flavin-dependent oxidoreductase (luciferase family)